VRGFWWEGGRERVRGRRNGGVSVRVRVRFSARLHVPQCYVPVRATVCRVSFGGECVRGFVFPKCSTIMSMTIPFAFLFPDSELPGGILNPKP
jgi:hypothetical protein